MIIALAQHFHGILYLSIIFCFFLAHSGPLPLPGRR
jgi:hypothetical protein